MNGRLGGFISVALFIAVAAGGGFAGTRLGERASEPGSQVLTLDRPVTVASREAGVTSVAGFSGFEEGALGGLVARSGTAEDVSPGLMAVTSTSARAEVRYTAPTRFYAIRSGSAAQRPLQAGDVVVLRVGEDDEALGILRVPGDIREGDSR